MTNAARQSTDAVGAVTSAVIQLAPQSPFDVGLAVEVVTGSISATVQYTMDNCSTATEIAAANWIDHPYLATITANSGGNFFVPVKGCRLVNGGAGTARLVTLQMLG